MEANALCHAQAGRVRTQGGRRECAGARITDPETKTETDEERGVASTALSRRLQVPLAGAAGLREPLVPELVDYAAEAAATGESSGSRAFRTTASGSMTGFIRNLGRFLACSEVALKECKGFVRRTATAGRKTYLQETFRDEPSCELVYRKLVDSSETGIERVVIERTRPLQIES